MARNSQVYPEQHQGYPAIGAYHEVFPNDRLDSFMESFRVIANKVLIPAHAAQQAVDQPLQILDFEETGNDEDRFRPSTRSEAASYDDISFEAANSGDKLDADMYHHILTWKHAHDYYRAYNGTSMYVSVLDMTHSERHARTMRSIWQKQDLGDTKQMARNEIDRRMPDTRPRLQLDQISRAGTRLPNAPASHEGRKLALVPNPSEYGTTIDMLCEEHNIIIAAINKRLKSFVPYGEFMPHVTFAWFSGKVTEEQLAQIARETKALAGEMPIKVNLDPYLTFRDRLTRSLTNRR